MTRLVKGVSNPALQTPQLRVDLRLSLLRRNSVNLAQLRNTYTSSYVSTFSWTRVRKPYEDHYCLVRDLLMVLTVVSGGVLSVCE